MSPAWAAAAKGALTELTRRQVQMGDQGESCAAGSSGAGGGTDLGLGGLCWMVSVEDPMHWVRTGTAPGCSRSRGLVPHVAGTAVVSACIWAA